MSDQIIQPSTWRPRWYYILRNKTSGKKYVGQTMQESMDKYCGSGGYWIKHCKKHGGLNRQNIEVLGQVWIEDKHEAQQWLDAFAEANTGYWLKSDIAWANACRETTEASPFAGIDWADPVMAELKKETGRRSGKIVGQMAIERGWLNAHKTKEHQSYAGKLGGSVSGKIHAASGQLAKIAPLGGRKNVESGHLARISSKGGKAAAKTKLLMMEFCKLCGIDKPGRGFEKMDKEAFLAWKAVLV